MVNVTGAEAKRIKIRHKGIVEVMPFTQISIIVFDVAGGEAVEHHLLSVVFHSGKVEDEVGRLASGTFASPTGHKQRGAGAKVIDVHCSHGAGVRRGVHIVHEPMLFALRFIEQAVLTVA